MRLQTISLLLLAMCLNTVSLLAQSDLYDNGPINGQQSAWTINSGFTVSDTFTLMANSSVNGLSFGAWVNPDLTLQTVEVQITSSEFGGTTYTDQVVNFTASNCVFNQRYDYNVCEETGTFGTAVNLNAGTYWLNLSHAETQLGEDDPVYWDENSGPSLASENSVGTIPSESFTLLGSATGTTTSTGTTPEPSGALLFGSGLLGMAGILRRKSI